MLCATCNSLPPTGVVNLRHALGTICNCLWALLLSVTSMTGPPFPLLLTSPMFLDSSTEVTLHSLHLVEVEKLRGREGELWLLVLAGKGSFHLQLLRCLASREKLAVAGFCSVMVEMSSYLGSYGPSSGRAGRSLCYSHIPNFKAALYYLLTL
jgi:hypothetical protein